MKWAKVATDLPTNPKVRAAGRNALGVFTILLLKHAELELDGELPARYCTAAYIAPFAMMSVEEAVEGLVACQREDLIATQKDGSVALVGWDDEWRSPQIARRAAQARYAAKKRAEEREARHRLISASNQPDTSEASAEHQADSLEESRDLKPVSGSGQPSPSRPIPAEPVEDPDTRVGAAPVPVPGPDPALRDAKLATVDRVWRTQESGIDALQADGVDPHAPRLGLLNGQAKAQLAQRIAERAAEGRGYEAAEADCARCLATWFAEARERHRLGLLPALRYLKGAHWEAKNFERALMTSPEEAMQRVRELKAREARLRAVDPSWVAQPPKALATPAPRSEPREPGPVAAPLEEREAYFAECQAVGFDPERLRRRLEQPEPAADDSEEVIAAAMAEFAAAGSKLDAAREVTKLFGVTAAPQPTRRADRPGRCAMKPSDVSETTTSSAYAAPSGAGEAPGAELAREERSGSPANQGRFERCLSVPIGRAG